MPYNFAFSGTYQLYRGVQYGASPLGTTTEPNPPVGALLQENGSFLLQENTSFILL